MQNDLFIRFNDFLKQILFLLFEYAKMTWGKILAYSVMFKNQTAENYPAIFNYIQRNRLLSVLMVFGILLVSILWLKAFLHAAKNEPEKKAFWKFIVFFLGPFGAIVYYFLRIRILKKKAYEKQRIELSFFAPMSKRPPK